MVRLNWRVILMISCGLIAGIWFLVAFSPGFVQGNQTMGPKDVAIIPIASVPDWIREGIYSPSRGFFDAEIQVLAVLKDPRKVPLERFLYSLTQGRQVIVHPLAEQIRDRFPDGTGAAVAIYMRVTAPEVERDIIITDPFYVQTIDLEEKKDYFDAPFRAVGIIDTEVDGLILPCLDPMTIAKRARSFIAPDTGLRVYRDVYLPPEPHYVVVDQTNVPDKYMGEMDPGEVREGWVLCLAPDALVDQISVVNPGNHFREHGMFLQGYPYWTREVELVAGEWALFEDQVVLGWNGSTELGTNTVEDTIEKTVVHEGDVWVSVGQALRYARGSLDWEHPDAHDDFIIQFYFEGMEELQDTWEHFVIQEPFELEICDGIEFDKCQVRNDLNNGIRTDISILFSRGRVSRWVYAEDPEQEVVTAWVRIRQLKEGPYLKETFTWKLEIHPAREEEGEKFAACELGECIPSGANFFYSHGDPYDRDEGRWFEEDVDIPIIPLGEEARGFRIVSAKFVSGEIFRVYGERVALVERDFTDPFDSKWLIVEVESSGGLYPGNVLGNAEDQWYLVSSVDSYADHGIIASYPVAGNYWDSTIRSARRNVLLVGKVPRNWQMEDLVITSGAGPAWRLQ